MLRIVYKFEIVTERKYSKRNKLLSFWGGKRKHLHCINVSKFSIACVKGGKKSA